MEKYIKILKKIATKAYFKNEIPVSCIIVKDDKIISRAYNKKEKEKNPLKHAEIIAINKACKKLKDWRLDKCIMYVTLKPCEMCQKIIEEARIKKVVYILESKSRKKQYTKYEKCDIEEENFEMLITGFFKEKR